jgi:large subunit ribosomal protein L4
LNPIRHRPDALATGTLKEGIGVETDRRTGGVATVPDQGERPDAKARGEVTTMEVPVYNMQGAQVAQLKIDEAALGGKVNPALVKQAYVMYHANVRQGSSKTKNRHEVEGSTKKMYKQKGTGNARHGDRKVNIFKGGGHGHSKKRTREDFRQTMPTKMRRKANRNAFLAQLMDDEVRVIDSISFAQPKTKDFQAFLASVKVDRSALIALPMDSDKSRNAMLSGRNVDGVTIVRSDQINAFNMLNHRYMVIGRAELEAWLSGPSSQTTKDAKINPLGRKADASKGGK